MPSSSRSFVRWASAAATAILATGCASRACPTGTTTTATSTTPASDATSDVMYACKVPTGAMTASFAPDIRLPALVAWATGFTCKTFIYDPSVADRSITIVAPGKMSADGAYKVFVGALASMNLSAQADGELVRIVAIGPAPTRIEAIAEPPPPSDDADAEALAAAIDAGITRVDDQHYVITRALIDRILANPMAVAKGARVVPSVKDGVPNGFKLYAIRPSSVYAHLGLANGDTIHSVNGFELTSVDKALEVYTTVRDATHLEIEVTRRGKPLTLTYTIK